MHINKKIRSGLLRTVRGRRVHSAVWYLQQGFQTEQLVLQQTAVLSHVFEGELVEHLHVAVVPTVGGSEARRQPLGLEAVVVLKSVVAPEMRDKNKTRRRRSLGLLLGTYSPSRLGHFGAPHRPNLLS